MHRNLNQIKASNSAELYLAAFNFEIFHSVDMTFISLPLFFFFIYYVITSKRGIFVRVTSAAKSNATNIAGTVTSNSYVKVIHK